MMRLAGEASINSSVYAEPMDGGTEKKRDGSSFLAGVPVVLLNPLDICALLELVLEQILPTGLPQ